MSRRTLIRTHLVVSALSLVAAIALLAVTLVVQATASAGFVALAVLIAGSAISGRSLAGSSPSQVLRRKLRRTQAAGVLVVILLLGVVPAGEVPIMVAIVVLLGWNLRDGLELRKARLDRELGLKPAA